MGKLNCKECIAKDSSFIRELCLGQDKENPENEDKTYVDKAGNKTKHKKKESSRSDEKNSEFSKINDEKLAMEDKEILAKIGISFKKINSNELYSQNTNNNNDNFDLVSPQENNNNHIDNYSEEGRYIDPYGQNYQDYDLSNLEYKQDPLQYDQNPGAYISYKELKISQNSLNVGENNKGFEGNKPYMKN